MDLPKLSQAEIDEEYLNSEELAELIRQEDEAMDAMSDAERIEAFGCACAWWRGEDKCPVRYTYVQEGNVIKLVKE